MKATFIARLPAQSRNGNNGSKACCTRMTEHGRNIHGCSLCDDQRDKRLVSIKAERDGIVPVEEMRCASCNLYKPEEAFPQMRDSVYSDDTNEIGRDASAY